MRIKKMVATIQKSDEYFLSDIIEESPVFDYVDDDTDKQVLVLFFLYLLERLYQDYESKTPEYVLANFENDVDKLLQEFNTGFESLFNEYIDTLMNNNKANYNLSEFEEVPILDEYSLDTTRAVTLATFYALFDQLKCDAITKARVWMDSHVTNEGFNLVPNFNRAIKRVKDAFGYATTIAQQKIERNILSYVYGVDELYYWVCAGPNPCAWCLMQQSMPPRPLNEWEYDHIHGHCILVPITEMYNL